LVIVSLQLVDGVRDAHILYGFWDRCEDRGDTVGCVWRKKAADAHLFLISCLFAPPTFMCCTRRSIVQWFPFDYYRNNHRGTLPVCMRHTEASMPIVPAAFSPIKLSGGAFSYWEPVV